MPLSDIASQIGSLQQKRLAIDDFSGGLQLAGRIADIPTKYLLQARNVDLTGGRLRGRIGYGLVTGTPAFRFDHGFYSHIFDYAYLLSETDNKLYRTNDLYLTGTFTDVTGILPLSGGTSFAEFNGAIVAATPSGIYASTDGTTWSLITAAVKGTMIVAWQNKLFVAGDPVNKTRVWWCNPGDYTTWTTATDWVDVREGEGDAPITCLHATTEMDPIGRPSLLVFKRRSLHRINSASNGSFTTLNYDAGTNSRRGAVSSNGMTCFIAETGIYATNGNSPAVEIGIPVRPLWARGTVASASPYAIAYAVGPRFWFHMNGYDPNTAAYQTFQKNVVHLEWNAETKVWNTHVFAAHTLGVRGHFVMPAGSPPTGSNIDRTRVYHFDNANPSQIFRMWDEATSLTSDAGSAPNFLIQTPYIQLAGGTRARIHRLRLSILESFATTWTLRVRRDGSSTDSIVRTKASPTTGLVDLDFNRLGNCRNVSFLLERAIHQIPTSPYRPDANMPDKPEIVRMLIEYTPTGLN